MFYNGRKVARGREHKAIQGQKRPTSYVHAHDKMTSMNGIVESTIEIQQLARMSEECTKYCTFRGILHDWATLASRTTGTAE